VARPPMFDLRNPIGYPMIVVFIAFFFHSAPPASGLPDRFDTRPPPTLDGSFFLPLCVRCRKISDEPFPLPPTALLPFFPQLPCFLLQAPSDVHEKSERLDIHRLRFFAILSEFASSILRECHRCSPAFSSLLMPRFLFCPAAYVIERH